MPLKSQPRKRLTLSSLSLGSSYENTREHDAYSEASDNLTSHKLAISRQVLRAKRYLAGSLLTHLRSELGCEKRQCQSANRCSSRSVPPRDRLVLRKKLHIKDARMCGRAAHRRPRYSPTERLAILEVRAAGGWVAPAESRYRPAHPGNGCVVGTTRRRTSPDYS